MAAMMITAPAQAQDVFREVDYSQRQTTFKLNAPSSARKVVVRLYEDGDAAKPYKAVKMKRTGEEDEAHGRRPMDGHRKT